MRDVLKMAAGVFLGLLAFAVVSSVLSELSPENRAARDFLDRQFAPAN